MPEARTPNSDFNRAFGDAKKQAAGAAGEVSDAAQEQPIALRRSPTPRQGPRGKLPVLLRKRSATR
jgi:hypothetical protein